MPGFAACPNEAARQVYEGHKLIRKLASLSGGALKHMRKKRDNCYGELGILWSTSLRKNGSCHDEWEFFNELTGSKKAKSSKINR